MKYYTRQMKKYEQGEVIFSENSPCDGMYIIDYGRVRVFKTLKNNGCESKIELCSLGAKAIFGEMAMIDENRRSATVQAIKPTQCTIITKQIFDDQLSRIPPWMVNMIKILVNRLRDTNNKLRVIIEENMSVRLEENIDVLMADSTIEPLKNDQNSKVKSDEIIDSLFKK